MKDWIPTVVALIAIAASAANFMFSIYLNRQKSNLDQKMKSFESDLSLLAQERSAAASSFRAQLNAEIADIMAAITAAQEFKDRIHSVQNAILNPGSTLKSSAISEFTKAREGLERTHGLLVRYLDKNDRTALHESKTQGIFVSGLLIRELKGARFIEGAPDHVQSSLVSLVRTLDEAQKSLRDLITVRQSLLNSGVS